MVTILNLLLTLAQTEDKKSPFEQKKHPSKCKGWLSSDRKAE